MLLDAVLDDRDFVWLGPSMDKRRHFMRHLGDRLEVRDYPHLLFGDGPAKTVRYFPDKLPIGMQPYGEPPRLRLPGDAPVADGLPAVPPAAHGPAPGAAPMDRPAAVSTAAREVADWPICTPRGSTWRRRWTRRTSRRSSGSSPSGSGSPNPARARPTQRYLKVSKRLSHSAISGALPAVAGRSHEHTLDGRVAHHRRQHRPRPRPGRVRRAVTAVPPSLPLG